MVSRFDLVRVYDYSDVPSIVSYLTFVFIVLAHAGRENSGISDGRLGMRLLSFWVLLFYLALGAFGSSVCGCVA